VAPEAMARASERGMLTRLTVSPAFQLARILFFMGVRKRVRLDDLTLVFVLMKGDF